MNFNNLQTYRRKFIEENKEHDHAVVDGKNNILLSAPHGVSQVRLGKYKFSEIGSLTTVLHLQKSTDSYLIAKTKNNNDDANFDEVSLYKSKIEELIYSNNIKYVIDFHGLSSKRECDVNLGTHIGKNIKPNEYAFDNLYNALTLNGFKTEVDMPFMAGNRTISGSVANNHPEVWTIQIEINCAITNKKENFTRYKLLLGVLTDWLNSLN